MAKRFIETSEQVVCDEQGNERVRTTRKVVVHKMENENFYMVFTNYVGWLYNLKGVMPFKVLHYLMEHAQVNTGRVALTTGMRQEMMEELSMSRSAFWLAITQLTEANVISKVYRVNKSTGEQTESKGEFIINPEMLWKGDREKRAELRVTFEAIFKEEEFSPSLADTE